MLVGIRGGQKKEKRKGKETFGGLTVKEGKEPREGWFSFFLKGEKGSASIGGRGFIVFLLVLLFFIFG